MAFSIVGLASVVGLQFQGLTVPVGDESMIAVGGEDGTVGQPGVGFTRRTMSLIGAAPGSCSGRGVYVVCATSSDAPSIQ